MVRIGTVWDRTTEVVAGRTAWLAGIAAATLFVPTVIRDAWGAYVPIMPNTGMGVRVIGAIIAIAALLAMVYGHLALTALSSDPATTRADAYRIAGRRFGAAVAVAVVGIAVVVIVGIPAGFLLRQAGFDFQAASAGTAQVTLSPGGVAGAGLYILSLSVVFLVVASRLAVLWPVIVNERLGLGAFARAFRLTRGMTWKLIGVLILYAIVLVVALAATTSIVGVVFRLALGAENAATATFLAAIAGAVVTTIFAVLQTVFSTQLYLLLRDDSKEADPAP